MTVQARLKRTAGRRRLTAALACALAGTLGFAAAQSGGGPEPASAAKQTQKRPNIIVIMTDDQSLDTFRPDVMPSTFELLVDRGTTFKNFVATTSTCCPSRATFLTGQYAHNTRVLSNNPGYNSLVAKNNVLPVWLQQAGYKTAHIGKWLNKYGRAVGRNSTPAPGWDEWVAALEPRRYYDYDLQVNGETVSYGTRPADYNTRVLDRFAVRLIDRYVPKPDPFFMTFAPYAVHNGSGDKTGRCAGAAVPGPHDGDLFVTDPIPKKDSFNEANVDDKPTFIRRLPPISFEQSLDIQRRWGCALATLRGVDRAVEDIYNAVREAGELNNTVFIFWSDNGLFYGEHRLPGQKQQAYEEASRLPLVILPPGGRGPSSVTATTANIDLAPTILNYAGAQPCRRTNVCRIMDGRTLTPLLRGAGLNFPADRHIVLEYRLQKDRSRRGSTCAYSGLWTPSEVYVEHRRSVVHPETTRECEKKFEWEHYNLLQDPFQIDNLAYNPSITTGDTTVPDPVLQPLLGSLRFCAGVEGRDPLPAKSYCE